MPKPPTVALSAEDEMAQEGDLDSESRAELAAMEERGECVDLTSYRLNKPVKVRTVACLLQKGFSVREVCKIARVGPNLVCQVRNDPEYAPSLASHKGRVTALTRTLILVGLEAKLAQWTAEGAKAPDVFDLKLLRDMAALDEGGATQRVEHVHSILNPSTSATLRLLEASSVTIDAISLQQGIERVLMGSESQKVHALPLESEVIPEHKYIRENEVSPPNIEHEL